MDKFVIRSRTPIFEQTTAVDEISKRKCEEINLDDLPADPANRRRMSKYNPNDREKIRRAYLQRGAHQPRTLKFPQKVSGDGKRRFNLLWFDFHLYKPWLEYSEKEDAAFCLYCYLCADEVRESDDTSFTTGGFSNWKKPERFQKHIGGVNSAHNKCRQKCEDLMNQSQHIEHSFVKQSDQSQIDYETRLLASVDCVRYLLHQGIAFRGHDESEDSSNQGNFKELLKFLADHNEEARKVILKNAPGNNKLSSHQIQIDIASACAIETTKIIIDDIGNENFSILVDECRDASTKEQMAVVLRYLNKKGYVVERFLGIMHVTNTSSLSLKAAICSLLAIHKLSVSRIRGQGYDGASNMRGEFNGLKSLILKDNSSAYYVHCFAHQLQLVLVAVATNHVDIALLFTMIGKLVNVVGGSCKRRDMLRDKQVERILKAIDMGETNTGKGLNQEYTIQRATDTRWSSHYKTLVNISILFPSIIEVLEYVFDDGGSGEQKADAIILLDWVQSFDFVFALILMKNILGITNELSIALQRKDQDIVNAMQLLNISRQRLQMMRDNGWESLFGEVSAFCDKHNIGILKMDDLFLARGRPRRTTQKVTNLHHFEIELLKTVIDWVLQELKSRFSEVTTELLCCMSCLIPDDSFSCFNKEKLIRLAELYSSDFSETDRVFLENQLETYYLDMKSSTHFTGLKGIGSLAAKLVETNKIFVYPLVYQLIKLVLILPVSSASVERAFSAMKIVKTRLRTKIGDQWMNDCLVTYIEKEVFQSVKNDDILKRHQNMGPRRFQRKNDL